MNETRPTYEGRPLPDPHHDVVDQGLGFDLETLSRRRTLRLFGGAVGAALLAACTNTGSSTDVTAPADGGGSSTSSSGAGTTTATPSAAATAGPDDCSGVIPEETAGPFPGDGSNGPDVLAESGVVRRDIRTSIGAASGTAEGVPLEIEYELLDADAGCVPLAGAAVYSWQCDALGRYSMYSDGVTSENWLRGVQEADADGVVRFTSIFPGCYPGRWPHVHFEVFETLEAAGSFQNRIATSQIALPRAESDLVYATTGYDGSAANLARLSLETDGVFRDTGGVSQLATTTGDPASGYTARLRVLVSRT